MIRSAERLLRAAHLAVLRGASFLVPAQQREEWYREWTGELSHAARAGASGGVLSWHAACELTRFCLGSIQDALCLRRMEPKEEQIAVAVSGSAQRCVFRLGAILALCWAITCALPGVRSQNDAAQNSPSAGVLLVENAGLGKSSDLSIPFRSFEQWNSVHQQFFTKLAFYRTEDLRVHIAEKDQIWRVAHASDDLLQVVGVTALAASQDEASGDQSRALLSESTWRNDFHSDPGVVGTVVRVGNHLVRIAGITPDGAWRLPAAPDLWILESKLTLAQASAHQAGYVIARLSSKGRGMMLGDTVGITEDLPNGYENAILGVSLASVATGTFSLYLFSLMLAVLAMPAVISVFQSEAEIASHRPSLAIRARSCAFLGAKFAIVAALGYSGGVDIAYFAFAAYSPAAQMLQILCSFVICLAGFRWTIQDQSRRCPVCLRTVTHPAWVGTASCNFLGWNGTEMVCMGGHTLLHVPNLPTSWFSRQRWTYLDKSWDFLFASESNRA